MEQSSLLYTKHIGKIDSNDSDPIGIMLHGFGASADSIANIAQEMHDTLSDWIIPQGDIDISEFLGTAGYAWFPHEKDEITSALLYSSHMDPDGLRISAERIYEFLKERSLFNRPCIIAGFSQGGMIASELALLLAQKHIPLKALIIFSSCLIAKQRWNETAHAIDISILPPVWQSHGESDTVLPLKDAMQLHEFWNMYSTSAELYTFDGGHDIPADVLQQATRFISTHL